MSITLALEAVGKKPVGIVIPADAGIQPPTDISGRNKQVFIIGYVTTRKKKELWNVWIPASAGMTVGYVPVSIVSADSVKTDSMSFIEKFHSQGSQPAFCVPAKEI
jgi:hypothetical protein